MPEWVYAALTPVRVEERDTAVAKLDALGVRADDVRYVLLSHFHADHVAAVKDFPRAKYVYLRSAYDYVARLGRVSGVRNGVLRGLLPWDFEQRSEPIEDNALRRENDIPLNDAFSRVYDLFGDQSLYVVDLPGHTRGHMGLFLRDAQQEHFLIADACWLSRSYREMTLPSRLAMSIFDDAAQYKDTLARIQRVYRAHPRMNIAPSHCGETYRDYVQLKSRWGQNAMNALPT